MKRVWLGLCAALVIFSAGCNKEVGEEKDQNQRTPRSLVVEYQTARLQKDYKKAQELTVKKNVVWENGQGAQNGYEYKQYKLVEYVINNDNIIYDFIAKRPSENEEYGDVVKVIRTKKGFKIEDSTSPSRDELDKVKDKVTPTIIEK